MRLTQTLPADLADAEVAEVAFQKRRAQTGNDFLPSHLQKVVMISCVLRNEQGIRIFSIGEPEAGGAAAIQRLFQGINPYLPKLLSWDRPCFDVPGLGARGPIPCITPALFWATRN